MKKLNGEIPGIVEDLISCLSITWNYRGFYKLFKHKKFPKVTKKDNRKWCEETEGLQNNSKSFSRLGLESQLPEF